jgi:hypothetical protein
MNPSNLYESYLGIYDLSESDPKDHPDIKDQRDFADRASREMERRRNRRANAKRAKIESGIKGPKPALFNANVPSSFRLKEQDNYDLILNYLLDEGFAPDETSARIIMSNMSKDWIHNIINELN